MIKARLIFVGNEIQKGINVGKIIECSLVIFVINEAEDEFAFLRAVGIDWKDRLGKQHIDSVFNENPSFLRSFQHVEIVGLVLELKISLHYKT